MVVTLSELNREALGYAFLEALDVCTTLLGLEVKDVVAQFMDDPTQDDFDVMGVSFSWIVRTLLEELLYSAYEDALLDLEYDAESFARRMVERAELDSGGNQAAVVRAVCSAMGEFLRNIKNGS